MIAALTGSASFPGVELATFGALPAIPSTSGLLGRGRSRGWRFRAHCSPAHRTRHEAAYRFESNGAPRKSGRAGPRAVDRDPDSDHEHCSDDADDTPDTVRRRRSHRARRRRARTVRRRRSHRARPRRARTVRRRRISTVHRRRTRGAVMTSERVRHRGLLACGQATHAASPDRALDAARLILFTVSVALVVQGYAHFEIGRASTTSADRSDVVPQMRDAGPILDFSGRDVRSIAPPHSHDRADLRRRSGSTLDTADPRRAAPATTSTRRSSSIGSQVADHPELVRASRADGNEIGIHTFTHADLAAVPRLAARTRARADPGRDRRRRPGVHTRLVPPAVLVDARRGRRADELRRVTGASPATAT